MSWKIRLMAVALSSIFVLAACSKNAEDEDTDAVGDDDDDDDDDGGLTEEEFAELFEELLCAEFAACNPAIDCDSDYIDVSGCTFDAELGQECLDGTYECNDDYGPGFEYVEVPAACLVVYDC